MKRVILSIVCVLGLSVGFAQIPGTLSYQGILVDGAGAPVADGTHFVKFDFYNVSSGGSAIYSSTGTGSGNSVTTFKGMFTFIIGSGSAGNLAIPTNIWDSQVYVEVTADLVVLTPRIQLTSNAYSFKAQAANTMDAAGLTGSANLPNAVLDADLQDLADGSLTGSKVGTGIVAGNITSGSLAVLNGGTGATTAAAARTNLGLGSISTLSAISSTEITDGTIVAADLGTGSVTSAKILDGDIVNADINAAAAIADTKLATISTAGKVSVSAISGTLAMANGGTGATTAAAARTNLGLIIGTDVQAPISATNGLTLASNIVALGGTLAGNTTIASSGNNLMFSGTGKFGLASPTPQSKLSVGGNVAIGNTYADNNAAPNNGLAVEGLAGIGTASPTNKLHVVGDGTTELTDDIGLEGNGSTTPILSLIRTSGSFTTPAATAVGDIGQLAFEGHTGSAYTSAGLIKGVAETAFNSGVNGGLTFVTASSGSLAERMRITSSGFVGIGTAAPAKGLEVNSPYDYQLRLSYPGSSAYAYDMGRNISDGFLHFYGNQTTFTGYVFGGISGEYMRIINNGNVGIGTTSPLNKLDVDGGLAVGATYSGTNTAPSNGAIIEGNVAIGTTTTSNKLHIYGNNDPLVRLDGPAGSQSVLDFSTAGTRKWSFYVPSGGTDFNIYNAQNGANVIAFKGGTGNIELAGNGVGNVGIGVVGPTNKFHVVGNTTGDLTHFVNQSVTGGTALQSEVITTATGAGTRYGLYSLAWYGQGSNFGVYGYGYGGAAAYGVYGTSGGATSNYGVYCSGNGGYTGSWSNVSDRKLKRDIAPMGSALSNLLKLTPSTYYYKTDEYSYMALAAGKQIGLIAQEVEPLFPEVITANNHPGPTDEKGQPIGKPVDYKGIDYNRFVPVLIKSIQEQQTQIEDLKSTVADLKSQLNQYKELSAQVEDLKKLMAEREVAPAKSSSVSGGNKK